MARKNIVASSKKTTQEEQVEEPASTSVVEETIVDTQNEEQQEDEMEIQLNQMQELAGYFLEIAKKLDKEVKNMKKQVIAKNKRLAKLESKSKKSKKRSGENVLAKPQPIYTEVFQQFIEKNHSNLTDKNGDIIMSELSYNDEGRLMVSRSDCLKLVNAYVRMNNLQYPDQKKRIKMDSTMKRLFPDLAEKKDKKGKVIEEENCYYHSLMQGISPHLKAPESS